MKKKKIKLEELKIQSFSTSHRLSKKDTEEVIGGGATDYTCLVACTNTCPTNETCAEVCGGTNTGPCYCPTNTCNHTDPYICDTHPEYC